MWIYQVKEFSTITALNDFLSETPGDEICDIMIIETASEAHYYKTYRVVYKIIGGGDNE
jgi:hypothetical protein